MQRLIFEYDPLWILACLATGLMYAFVLYQKASVWSQTTNRILMVFRALAVSVICFLLIGPILKLTNTQPEKPSYVFLIDNSASVKETVDSAKRTQLLQKISEVAADLQQESFATEVRGLDGHANFSFSQPTSDLQQAIKKVLADYEGRNLAGLVLMSDGIYNDGTSPLYTPLRLPVYTIGVGDTTERLDLALKNIAYNKIAYQGNRFPLHTDVVVKGTSNQNLTVQISKNGKVVETQQRASGAGSLVSFDFLLDATANGLQRFDVSVVPLSKEVNVKNNRASIYVDVVEGKKKILIVSPAPHPDIKALRSVIDKNNNYEVTLHLVGISKTQPADLAPSKYDLAIFLQSPDGEGKTSGILQSFIKGTTNTWIIIGAKSNLRQLPTLGLPFTFENASQRDDASATINGAFADFTFSEALPGRVASYPPLSVPFGKFTFPPEGNTLLYQRIGSVATTRPLLITWGSEPRMAALLGEGIWRWRMSEYAASEKTEVFDELFSKLVQYLSSKEDKRKFRSFPLSNEFSDAETVVFESQVYNDLFEPVYGNTIELEIRDDQGVLTTYRYAISPSGARFRLGNLKEGVYHYRASTEIGGKKEEVRGEFLVVQQNLEAQNLTADFGLLRKLSENTGGRFYREGEIAELGTKLKAAEAKAVLHSEDSFHPIINIKAAFFFILLLISAEWFVRKYLGSY